MPSTLLNPAEVAANTAQLHVNACIDARQNFRLEAGAGAGKTYSLVKALKRLITDHGNIYIKNGQKVACITYTQVARDEIIKEIDGHPAIVVETIHSFCWGFMSRFQSQLRALIPKIQRNTEKVEEVGGLGSRAVEYNLGFFGIDEDKVTISHDDVPQLMAKLMDLRKFRQQFTSSYPVLLIDEYQDTDKDFAGAVAKHFFEGGEGPLVGLFGDHWQTIYRDDFGFAEYANVKGINKGANFRSVPAVVNVLNRLRPELFQVVKDPEAIGEARVFHTNAYVGDRTDDTHSKEDLFAPVAQEHLAALRARLTADGWDFSPTTTKILMLTHVALAEEQGYPGIVEVFKKRKEAFAKKEDSTIAFLVDTLEPMYRAYESGRYGEMFHILGKFQPIRSHAEKEAWRTDMFALGRLRLSGTVGNVLDHLKTTRRPRLPARVSRREDELLAFDRDSTGEEESSSLKRHRGLRAIPYPEIVKLTEFIEGSTPFATQHSVKGAEFENVLVVLAGGWNHYNWPRMLDAMHTREITPKNEKGFYRSRNLFYVVLSRPKKRLAVLLTQRLSSNALKTLEALFGPENVHSLTL
ncbi:MAG: UvrD-helicase domain-containing protein [Proteobacteria bacterium]|nr:UvrD-helicase domain-containing protein [Pseudomonadota bacterium]MBU1595457.1 UvrD-helicase domain-containing protein [Pseudomonadota bacterium]